MTGTLDDLTSVAFVLTVRPGMTGEYRRRHAEIWPEMATALRDMGILRYEIFLCEETRQVFGLQLRNPDSPPVPEPPVIRHWRAHMADVLEMDGDAPRRTTVERVFLLTSTRAGAPD
jgi:L-rhamnose mutarotase